MRRQIYIAFLSAIVLLGGSGLALAQAVERSGNVYHMRVCPGPGEPRGARCHAHVVTTHLGQIIRNAGPASGSYGPTDLQNAYGVTQSVTTSTPITGPWMLGDLMNTLPVPFINPL